MTIYNLLFLNEYTAFSMELLSLYTETKLHKIAGLLKAKFGFKKTDKL